MAQLFMISVYFAWIACIIVTAIICNNKNLNTALWTVLSIFFGPIILLVVLMLPHQESTGGSKEIDQKKITLESIKRDLSRLKENLKLIEDRISSLERVLEPSSFKKVTPSELKPKKKLLEKPTLVIKKEKSLELNLGRYWLSKIGSFILVLGLAFLITYTFKFFNAWARIVSGYIAVAGLFWLGFRLEKEKKFKNYGRTILAAAWALLYFTTYAMHHIESSKILSSQLVDFILLSFIVGGLIIYSLRYKSSTFTAVALFTGYFTAALSDITFFTLASCSLLALAMVFLVCKLRMIQLIYYGIFFTYITHFVWVARNIDLSPIATRTFTVEEVIFWLNSLFLFIYWLAFNLAVYYPKLQSNETAAENLPLANFFNFLFFFFLEYSWISKVYPDFKFYFMLSLGFTYLMFLCESYRLKSERLIRLNYLIFLSLLTLSLPLKFSSHHSSLIWLIELPIILYLGLILRKRYLRAFGMILAIFLYFKYLAFTFSLRLVITILGANFLWKDMLLFFGLVSMYICYYLYWDSKISDHKNNPLSAQAHLYSFLGTSYLVMLSWSVLDFKWLTSALILEILALFFIGILISDKILRLYALILLVIPWFRMLFVDDRFFYGALKWPLIFFQIGSSFLIYGFSRFKRNLKYILDYEKGWTNVVFVCTTFILTVIFFKEILSKWVSLILGIEGAAFFAIGFLFKDRKFRTAGFVIFLVLLGRILFVDIAGLQTLYRIITFIVIGAIFLIISFIYTRYKSLKPK